MIDNCPNCGVDVEWDSSTQDTVIFCWHCGLKGEIIHIEDFPLWKSYSAVLWEEKLPT